MAKEDRYGLYAAFKFEAQGDSLAAMHRVVEGLRAIEGAITQTSRAVGAAGIAREFQRMGRQSSAGVGAAAQQFQKLKNQSTQAQSGLKNIAAEFRALRAEARNIDFGDLDDPQMFRQASRQIDQYIQKLKALEQQVDKTSPQGRTLAADLQRQQTIAQNRVSMADNQRKAALAQQRQSAALGVAAAGTAAFVPLVGIGKQAIEITAGFNDQMQQVKAVSDITAQELQSVRDKAKQLGAQTRFSASQAASGFVLLAQAGYPVEQQLAAIDGTLNLAAAGNLDLARATEITVSTLGQFQLEATKASHVANVLAKAAAMGQIDVTDIGMSLKYAGVSAKRAGLSIEQTSGMLALLSEGGLKGEMAGTALGQMLDGLVAPASTGAAALKQLGVITTDSSGKLLPYEQILGQTIQALQGVSNESERAALTNKIFGVVGGRAAGILMPRFNKIASTTETLVKTADKGIGAAREQAAIMEGDIGGSFRSLSSAMEGVFIEIGDVLVPIVKAAVDGITQVLGALIALPKPLKTVLVLAGVVATAIATLAVVGGTAAVAFFGLRAAMAEAKIAMIAMQAGGVPLTGFFARAMSAIGSGGLVGGFQALTASIAGLGASLGGVATSFAAFITGPVGLGVAAFAAILAAVQFLNPEINLLGSIFSAVAAPIGFLFGLVKGVALGIWDALKPIRDELAPVASALNPIGAALGYVGTAVNQAIATFQRFAGAGEGVGKLIGGVLTSVVVGPIVLLIRGVKAIVSAFTGAASLIRTAWQGFVDWFLAMPLVRFAMMLGQGLINALNHNPTVVIPLAWQGAVETIQGLFGGLVTLGESVGSALSTLLDPGKLFQNLVSGLLDRVQQLVAGIRESGIGNVFGGMLDGLDGFLGKLQGMAGQPITVAVEPVVKRQDSLAIAAASSPPPGGGTLAKIQQAFQNAKQQAFAPDQFTPVPHATPMPMSKVPTPDLSRPTREMMAGATQAATTQMRAAFDELTNMWGDRWAALQRSGSTDLMALFRPGLEALRQTLGELRGSFGGFLGETAQAIATLDFGSAKVAASDFGKSLLGAIQRASGAMGSLLLSTAAFGVFSLASLSPVVLVVGGIVLGVAAIATNFLGIRTILMGLVQIIRGAVQVVRGIIEAIAAVLKLVVRVGQAIRQITGGILPALRGDFSQIRQGFGALVAAFQTGAGEIRAAIARSIGGASEVFRGFGTVGRGVLTGLRQLVEGTGAAIRLAFQTGRGAVLVFGKAVQLTRQGFGAVLELPKKLVSAWQGAAERISQLPLVANLAKLRAAPERVGAIATELLQRWEALTQRLGLSIDLSRLTTVPERIQSLLSSIQNLFTVAVERIRQMPFVPDLSDLLALPGRVGGVVESIQARWVSTVEALNRQPVLREFAAFVQGLPQVFSAAVEKIQAVWGSLGNAVGGVLGRLRGKAKQTGEQLVSDLAENSPGPTFQIRTKWAIAVEQIEGRLGGLVGSARAAGQRITQGLSTDSLREKTRKGLGAVGNSFSSVGIVLSNFAPQLAAPLFLVGDLTSSFETLSESLPQLKGLLSQVAPKIQTIGSVAAGSGKAIAAKLIPMLVAGLGGAFSTLGAIAATAWTAIIAPALPFIAIGAAVVGVVALLTMAFRRNFLGIRTFAEGVFGLVRSVVGLIRGLFEPIFQGVARLQSAWQGFSDWFGGAMAGLPGFAMQAGQGLIDALNHNPTVVIPQAWVGAVATIGGLIGGTVETASQAGQAIATTLSSSPVIAPMIQLNPLEGAIASAKERAATLLSAVQSSVQGVAQQFQSATVTLTVFGATSVVSLAPLLLTIGAVALGALAIATNFLGLRTILGGVLKAVLGVGRAAVGAIASVVRVVGGLLQILSGIPAALRGDFSQILAGWNMMVDSIRAGATALMRGVVAVLEGGVQVIRGLLQGVGQVVRFDVVGAIGNTIEAFVQRTQALIQGLVNSVTMMIQKPLKAVQSLVGALGRGKQKAVEVASATMQAARHSAAGQTVGAFADVASGKAPTYNAARDMRRFDAQLARVPDQPTEGLAGASQDLARLNRQMDETERQSSATLSTVSGGMTSVGVALSSFAPAAAAPLFVVTDLFEGFQGLQQVIPAVTAALRGNAVAQAVVAAKAKLAAIWTGSVAIANALLAGGFAAVGTAAAAAWSAVLAPLLPIIGAVALIVGAVLLVRQAFRQNFGGIRDTVGAAVGQIREAIATVVDSFREVFAAFRPIGNLLFSAFLTPLRIAIGVIGVMARLFGGIVGLLARGLVPTIQLIAVPFRIVTTLMQGIVSLVRFVQTAVQAIGQTIWAALPPPVRWLLENLQRGGMALGGQQPMQPQRFATGGLVQGPGGGDRIPALLQNREFVTTPDATANNLGLLHAMNAGYPAEQVIRSIQTAAPTGQYGALEATGSTFEIGKLPAPAMVPPPVLVSPSQGDRPITIQVTVQQIVINGTDQAAAQQAASQLQSEILTAMEDPRFQIAVRETLRDMVERMR